MNNKEYPFLDEFNVEFSLYAGCKVNCDYCPHTEIARRVKERKLTYEKFKEIVDKIPSNVGIAFSGMVEPLIHSDFYKMVAYAKEANHKVMCCTTLPCGSEKNISCFLDDSLWAFRSAHLRDEYMSYKNNTSKYLENLEKYFISVSKNKINNEIYYHTKILEKEIIKLLEKYNLIDFACYVHPYKRIKASIRFNTFDNKKRSGKIICSNSQHKTTHILPDGDAVLCCMDVEKNHVLGNFLTHSYEDIINSEEYKKVLSGFNDSSVNTICRNCVFAKEI